MPSPKNLPHFVPSSLPAESGSAELGSAELRPVLEELNLARRIFDSVSNGVSLCDVSLPDLPLVYVNRGFEQMTGYTSEEVCGRNCRFLQGSHAEQPGVTQLRKAIREQTDVRVLLKNYRKNGEAFWNELYLSPVLDLEGKLTHFVGIQNDVTVQVESQARLDHLARHDLLTGLANRGLLLDQLKFALHRAKRAETSLAVLFLDLDNFKLVNDVYGHDAGDSLLRVVGTRLKSVTRAQEIVSRLGGDEFVLVIEDFSDKADLDSVMQRLTHCVSEPIELRGHTFAPSASIGVSLFPQDGDTPEALLKAADFNMYLAKHKQKSVEAEAKTAETSSNSPH